MKCGRCRSSRDKEEQPATIRSPSQGDCTNERKQRETHEASLCPEASLHNMPRAETTCEVVEHRASQDTLRGRTVDAGMGEATEQNKS